MGKQAMGNIAYNQASCRLKSLHWLYFFRLLCTFPPPPPPPPPYICYIWTCLFSHTQYTSFTIIILYLNCCSILKSCWHVYCCFCGKWTTPAYTLTHTHTHTHVYIYFYKIYWCGNSEQEISHLCKWTRASKKQREAIIEQICYNHILRIKRADFRK